MLLLVSFQVLAMSVLHVRVSVCPEVWSVDRMMTEEPRNSEIVSIYDGLKYVIYLFSEARAFLRS